MKKKIVFLSLLMVIMLFIITGCKRKVTTTSVLVPDKDNTTYYYTGEDIVYNIKENELYTISNNKQKNAGTYEVTVSLNDKTNCVWAKTGDTLDLKYEFIINPKKIDKPNVTVTEYGYTGEEITFDIPTSNFYTISNNKGTDAGEYQAKVSLNDKKNLVWSDDSTSDLTFNFSIVSNGISAATIEGINENYNYTGSQIMPNPIVKLANKTLTYNVDYTLAYENNVNVGTAKLTITGINTYSGTKVINYNILKIDPTYTAPTAKANLVYTSQEQELINAGSCDEGTIEYKLGNGEYSTSIPKATNAGTYTVYYRIIGDANHNNIENKTLNVTISKANPTITQPTIKSNLKYTGQPQELINAGSSSGGTLVYSLDGTNWNESIPTATNVDEYRIYYKVIGNENYNDLEEQELFVSIDKGIPQVTAPTAIENLVYDENPQVLINAGSTSGGTLEYKLENTDYLTTLPKAIGAGTYTIYYRVIGDANYEDVAEATITATIAKATPQITAPEENSIPYNGENQTLISEIHTPGETTIQYKLNDGTYSTDLPQAKDLGTYTVYYKLIGDSNYNDLAEQSVTITIIKGTPIVNITAAEDLEYNNAEQTLITSATTTGGTLKYSLDGTTYSTDVPVAINAGIYTVWYKVEADDNYNALEPQSIEVEIYKALPEYTAPTAKTTLFYSGDEQVLINAGSTEHGTIEYKLGETGQYSNNLPKATNAGTYTVYYRIIGDLNHESIDDLILNVKIEKATPVITLPTAINNLTYTGNEQTLINNDATTTGGTLVYSLDDLVYSEDLPTAINAGTYTVYVMAIGDDNNYVDSDSKSMTVEIKKATPTYEAPTAKTALIYNTEAQDLINAGSTEHGKFEYKLNDGEYTTSIPKGTNAGSYTVYYKLIGDANHKDVEEQTINVTINKGTPQITEPTAIENLVYNGEAQELIIAGTSNFGELVYSLNNSDYSTELPKAISRGIHCVWYKLEETDNYYGESASYIEVTIFPADPSVTLPEALELSYNGEAQELVTAGSSPDGTAYYSLNYYTGYSTEIPCGTNAGNYTVYFKIEGDDNHNNFEADIKVTISKATPVVTAPTAIPNLRYTGEELTLINAASTTGGTIKYSLNNIDYSTELPKATNAGTYTVYYKVEGNDNYLDTTALYISVTISNEKATPVVTAPVAIENLVYTGSPLTIATDATTTGGTLAYKLNDGNYGYTIPKVINAGSYTLYYKVIGDDNFKDIDEQSIEIEIAKADATYTAPTANSRAYTGDPINLVTGASTSHGTFNFKLGDGEYSTSIPQATNTGTYTVWYKIIGDNNHNDVDEVSIEVIISKATPVVTAPTAKTNLTYNKNEQILINAGSTTGGTINYSLDNITYSIDLPKATNAGTYTVYFKVEGNDNYENVDANSIEVTIAKATPQVSKPTAKILTYNREEQTLINAGSTTGGTLLYSLDNIDYSADLPSATNAGTYTVYYKVEGNDNYEGVDADSISVTISPRSINISSVNATLSQTSYTYNGSAFEPTVTSVTEGTFTFDSNLYEVTYSNNINAGQGQVIITAIDENYTGSKIVYFEILAKAITGAVITLEDDEYTYTSYSIEPVVTKVMLDTVELVKDTDYTVSYVTAKNVGTYNVTITGTGNYRLTATKSFTIVSQGIGISRTTLTLGDSNFIYNGNSQIPTITIVDKTVDPNYELVLGTDYTLSYNNSQGGNGNTTNAGTITITATGIGNVYVGEISDTYSIATKIITNPTIVIAPATYTGSSITPTITSVYDGETNITSLCSVSSGSSKTDAGTYDIQIAFSSNNSNVEGGPFPAQFTINPKDASALPINDINDIPYTSDVTTSGATPSVTIKDGTATLINGTDYTLEYSNNHGEGIDVNDDTKNTSVATITITYKGNYTGSATKTFNIVNREYTITYVNDETETTSKYHSIDDEVVLASPTKTGYNGYWNSTNGQFQFGATTTPATLNGDITLTAVWTEINYTITYHLKDDKASNSENNPTSYTITSNTITLEPATYANSNATFGGWYDNDELNGDAITEITQGSHENINLYAKWNYVSFNITYELNGGTNNPSNPASAIPTDTITLLDPTREYYDFEGWYTESTFNNKITQISNLTDHKTIYAKWTVHNYTITYNYDNNITSGSLIGSNSNPTLYNVENDPIVLSNVQAGGYRFDGWFDGLDNQLTTIDTSHPSDITITGKFTKHGVVLKSYLNDNESTAAGNTNTNSMSTTIVGQTAYALATVKPGYTFDGWYKVVDNNDVKVTEGLSMNNTRIDFELTVTPTLYKAKYYSYSLSYTSENATKGSVSLNVTNNMKANGTNNYLVPVGETATLTASTNAGYTFIGWFKNDETIATSASLEYTYTMTAANVSFEARWIQVTVELEQYDNIAEVTQLNSTYIFGENVTIVASTSVDEAIFLGWFKDSSNTPISTNLSYEFTMPDVDTTYTAKFVENLVTVQDRLLEYSFDSDNNVYLFQYNQNDTINSSYEIAVTGNQLTYTMSANAKFVFAGWYTLGESSKTLLSDEFAYTFTAPSEATLITALWVTPLSMAKNPDDEALTYTSSFDLVKNGISFTEQDNDSYTWNGWYNSNDTLNTNNKTLTLSYENSYKKLIDESDEFSGLPTYTAKWTLAGIVVQSADISRGTVEIDRTTNPYTIKAIPVAGYQFVRWTKDGVDYPGDAETTVTSNDGTATYVAHFETRSNIEYHVNIRLQDYNNPNDYTTLHSSSYTGNNGSTNGYVFISFPATTPTGYSFKETKIGNDVVTAIDSGENSGKYQLDIANDGSAEIDFYYDLLTVNVTYHHNDGTTPNATATTVKYDTTSGHYTLKSYNDATWYTNQYLTDTNLDDEADGSITYVDADAEVWACYDNNYNLADKFDLTNNLINDTYWRIVYKGTVAGATIVIPDYINDKPSKKVKVDNLYGKGYASLTMPSTLELIEYGSYSWIVLNPNTNNTNNYEYKLLSEELIGENVVYTNTTTALSNISSSISTTASLLTLSEYNAYKTIIQNYLIAFSDGWWTSTRNQADTGTYYVNSSGGTAVGVDALSSKLRGVRPTITLTL